MSLPKIVFLLCFFASSQFLVAQTDSVVIKMSDKTIEEDVDSTTYFFENGEKVTDPSKILLITKVNKTINLAAFLKNEDMTNPDHVLSDLDNDGKKELLISNYTGGAHCCDEIYVFKSIGVNKYQQAAKLFAGNTIITNDKLFVYNFYQQFGYFFTCFACAMDDSSDTAPVEMQNIKLKYSKGKLVLVQGTTQIRSAINDNLGKLSELPYEKLDQDLSQDNGLRKEFAMNLAVFYYSFGKNLAETQKLFNKYYKFPDAKKVWTAFVKEINYISSESSL